MAHPTTFRLLAVGSLVLAFTLGWWSASVLRAPRYQIAPLSVGGELIRFARLNTWNGEVTVFGAGGLEATRAQSGLQVFELVRVESER